MILLIDNYDSFIYNLARYLVRLGATVSVLRNDAPDLISAAEQSQAIVISPGPCGPDQAGQCLGIVQRYSGLRPILGVCLGHQIIVQAMGGKIIRAAYPIHGRALPIEFDDSPLFSGFPAVANMARYHSLVASPDQFPASLSIIARSRAEEISPAQQSLQVHSVHVGRMSQEISRQPQFFPEIMAVQHRQHPTFGVQFHPESVLSPLGYQLLANFLVQCGSPRATQLPTPDYAADLR
ncbi:MAG: aminodeoxychorismate/anthranilate synthase component II [Pirellulaceae bacterium]|nr:aminodeoxychorismate/anthranilate synthase component II [Pirellulaceae bacterium]